jgi:hypothetical protein
MSDFQSDWEARQRARWLRPDAARFMRPDYKRYLQSDYERRFLPPGLDAKYRPDQPRVPAGNPDGGQWTSEGGGSATEESDGTVELSASRRRSPPSEPTPGQAARLAAAEARAQDALQRVRQLDPSWRPTPSVTETVEGRIAAREAEAREAEARLRALAEVGIGPGPFANRSIEAPEAGRRPTQESQEELLRYFKEDGCHTCGRFEAGTNTGYPVGDHQPPTALNPFGAPQRLFPQCLSCSLRQGGWVRYLKYKRDAR